jgi:protein-S-isoprenylcysteine O-methyltransferase Ste14
VFAYFRGREARPAAAGWNVAKTLAQTIVFWGTFLVVLPAAVYALETALGLGGSRFASDPSRVVGAVLFALGGALGLTTGAVMAVVGKGTPLPADCPRELVVAGPYRFVRNPMAVAGLAQGVAVGVFLGSPAVVLYALAGGPVWDVFVRPWEERDLERRFGEPYRLYRRAVRCWRPRLTPYRPVG